MLAQAAQDAVDPVARWAAIAGIAIALVSLGLQVFGLLQARKRLVVTLTQSSSSTGNEGSRDVPLVYVRNEGRPISVDSIHFDGPDGPGRRHGVLAPPVAVRHGRAALVRHQRT